MISTELRNAVRKAAADHADRITEADRSETRVFIGDVLKDALAEAPHGIQPKVAIALKYIVEHLDRLEREVYQSQESKRGHF